VVREPYALGGVTSRIGMPIGTDMSVGIDLSAGVALFPADGDCAAALLQQARGALDRARAGGRGAVALCQSPAAAADTLRMDEELQHALELEQFEMAYQPVFGARSGVPLAYEAQVGWRHPARGLVPAAMFMPLCERSGMIEKLGRWAMHTACTEAATWAVPVRLSINIEGAQFRRGDLEHLVVETLHRSGLAADRLDLEVTEAVLREHSQQVLAAMLPLRTLGVRLVVDDFGQAAALQRFRDGAVQQVKLGRDAVRSMLTDPAAMSVVRSVLAMAAEMQIEAAAEGVEEPAQRDMLTHLGCGPMQGGLLGPPQSPERTRQYLWQATRRIEGGSVLLGAG
jgi:EAL domain-containing protein (putative c-di-GMP-specific phosphodiesterase class I)